MTYKNAQVLYRHRLSLGKSVDDILNIYPQLAEENKPKEEKKHGKKSKRRT